jgi:hypothetical protein
MATIPFDYTDAVMFGNIAEMINRDMLYTMNEGNRRIIQDGAYEQNPILARNTGNKDFVGGYGLLTTGILGNRWAGMDDDNQRRMEMLIAQAVQVGTLNSMGQPWKVQYGFQF